MDFFLQMNLKEHDQSLLRLYRLEPPKVRNHSTRFGNHSHCDGGDVIISICHVISQGHLVKRSCNFISRGP